MVHVLLFPEEFFINNNILLFELLELTAAVRRHE